MNLKTYNPKKRFKVNKEEAVPVLVDVGEKFASLGGMIGFFFSSFLASLKSFRKTKKRIREIQSKYEKTIDLS